ncbi:PHP domain-containing protein [Aliidiomarina indica]|uniref:PHP domain-containing protein n=1 Tax=Aliidiomarina indica TaxID=2749147 RepID=UPI00188EFDC8|nr:PHP domain-containing protein [Aliidiomarina indica]
MENTLKTANSAASHRDLVRIPAHAERIDLHCHSKLSDGSLTPTELILRAHTMQIEVLALTDHDSLSSYRAACEAQLEHDLTSPVLIPGVEISCLWNGYEIHILGWNFSVDNSALQGLIDDQQRKRRERSVAIYEKLVQQGVQAADLPDVTSMAPGQVLTRLHFAQALVQANYCKDIQRAFERYLGKGQCAYVSSQWCSIDEAIDAIRGAGGVAGLAHPLAYSLSNKWLRKLLVELKQAGAEAMEVVSSQQAPWQRQWLAELAQEYGFYMSVGSDFHHPGKYRELGRNLRPPEGVTPVWALWQ